nr:TIM barrel protein [Paenibacillus glycanilyticus]
MRNKEDFSFSTCWNIKKHRNGRAMLEEIMALGFQNVELNYNVTREHLTTIEPMIENGAIGISSVHHAFPFIEDKDFDTDSPMLGYEDEDKRRRALELLKQSVEYAVRYGAKAVVVHPGEVPFPGNVDARLKDIYKNQGRSSEAYATLWTTMLEQRQSQAPQNLERIHRSLEEISDFIERKGYKVAIGIETRARCYQIPTLREAEWLTSRLKGSPVGLWYDIGHAMMMERMGLYENLRDLRELELPLAGVHIHETIGLSDHWCPYVHSGQDDFDVVLDMIHKAPVRVYELKSACLPEEIEQSHNQIMNKLLVLEGQAK